MKKLLLVFGALFVASCAHASDLVQPVFVTNWSTFTPAAYTGSLTSPVTVVNTAPAPPYVGFFPSNAAFTLAASSDVIFNAVYIPTAFTATGVGYSVAVQGVGGKVDAGLYNSVGTKLASSGAQAIGAVGLSSSTFTAPISGPAGTYYVAGYINDAVSSQLAGVQATGSNQNPFCYRQAQTGLTSLPASITIPPAASGSKCFMLYLILAGGVIK